MNFCEALKKARNERKAIRSKDWPINLAWYHGMDNQICWWNDDPDGGCIHRTGNRVSFAIADFINDNYEIHPNVTYHGILVDTNKNKIGD